MVTRLWPEEEWRSETKVTDLLNRYFYFFMSLLIAVVVVYGFSHTVDKRLIHATPVRPVLLYFHAGVFSGWVILFIVQSALARMRRVRLHRQLGGFGVALGAAIPVLGIGTAVSMARFNIRHFGSADEASGLIISFFDMTAFIFSFAAAIYLRKRPEFHRRLLLIASCALTAAAFARFPSYIVPPGWFYAGVDTLILLGVTRDLIFDRRIHPVYLYALPALVVGQVIVVYTAIHDLPYWVRIGTAMLR
jgi:hypothetical protein